VECCIDANWRGGAVLQFIDEQIKNKCADAGVWYHHNLKYIICVEQYLLKLKGYEASIVWSQFPTFTLTLFVFSTLVDNPIRPALPPVAAPVGHLLLLIIQRHRAHLVIVVVICHRRLQLCVCECTVGVDVGDGDVHHPVAIDLPQRVVNYMISTGVFFPKRPQPTHRFFHGGTLLWHPYDGLFHHILPIFSKKLG
jgi:hypothetical protein